MGKRILLIDDDDLLCEVLCSYLELSGHAVIRAANGREGLVSLGGAGPFDLIVLDLLMPEMDGIRFLNTIDPESGPCPPVLVLSASATARVVDALDFPCVAKVMRKPIQPSALLEAIEALTGPG